MRPINLRTDLQAQTLHELAVNPEASRKRTEEAIRHWRDRKAEISALTAQYHPSLPKEALGTLGKLIRIFNRGHVGGLR